MAMKLDWTVSPWQLVPLLIITFGGGVAWNDLGGRVKGLESYVITHEATLKERRDANDGRFKAVEKAVDENEAVTERNTFRVTALEVAAPRIDANITELQRAINDLSGDTRVIKEILQRIEAAQTANAAKAEAKR
jgi:hypothetical protein